MKGIEEREEYTQVWLRKHEGLEHISDLVARDVIETLQSYSQIVSKVVMIEQEKGGGHYLMLQKGCKKILI